PRRQAARRASGAIRRRTRFRVRFGPSGPNGTMLSWRVNHLMNESPEVPGYRIVSVLGKGAMAVVYRAEHERLRKPGALKVMDPIVAQDDEYRERFLREARAAAKLNHENLVRALDAGYANGVHYIAMELVDGTDLRLRIEEEGTLPEDEALKIAISIAY